MKSNQFQTFIFLVLFNFFLMACLTLSNAKTTQIPATEAPATQETAPTLQPVEELSDDDIMAGIQSTLDTIVTAYAKNDLALYEQALDLDNKAFSRFVKTRFNTQQESFSGGGIELSYEVESIERRNFGLVLAHINYNFGAAVDWYFRRAEDGRWLLTEATVEQTGKVITTETDFFEFRTYPIADDVNAEVEQLMKNARDRVEAALGIAPDMKIEVEIIPTYGLYPFDSPNAIAYYNFEGARTGDGDLMVIYAPNSFLFGWYEESIGWQQDLENVLTHEYTHFTHARVFDYDGRLADWIVEGLAEYVDGVDRNHYLDNAISSDSLIPLTDNTEGVVYKQDLAHIYILEKDVALAYAEAESLVAFIVEEKGGFDGFWKFAQAYDDASGDLDNALQSSMNISQSEFEDEWINWIQNSGYLNR